MFACLCEYVRVVCVSLCPCMSVYLHVFRYLVVLCLDFLFTLI